jgi:outer membrane protein assembly factor BamE (lipoprotein component of BamABCDE complex)
LKRRRIGFATLGVVAFLGCRGAAPGVAPRFDTAGRFTCCNLHYEGNELSDANYWIGTTVPVGTPVRIESATPDSVTIVAGGQKLTLKHEYGTNEESFEQYVGKILVNSDPHRRIGEFPEEVQRAITKGKVERGMTREQVLLSLGYPPGQETPSLESLEWTYWYSPADAASFGIYRRTYRVVFDHRGKVTAVVGRPAPTAEVAIEHSDPVPPAPPKKSKNSSSPAKVN